MVIGLALAVATATAMYVTLFRSSPTTPSTATPPGNHIAKYKVTALRQLVTFAVVGAPDTVQIDPHGKIVVVSSESGQIGAWSTSNSRPIPGFTAIPDGAPAHSGGPVSPVFSPDGKKFSFIEPSSNSEVADVWNVTTGQVISVPLAVISSTFTPEYAIPGPGKLMADSYPNGTLGLTIMTTGAPDTLLTINRSGGVAYRIGEPVFSPDGKTIAIGDNLGMIHLVDVPGKRLSARLTAEKIYNSQANLNGMSDMDINTITFSPDSRRVACGNENGIIRVWDAATGRNAVTFNAGGITASGAAIASPVKTLVFSPDGKTLVTADNTDGALAVWDAASGHEVAMLHAATGKVVSAAFRADGTLIVATASGHRIRIWAVRPGIAANP